MLYVTFINNLRVEQMIKSIKSLFFLRDVTFV